MAINFPSEKTIKQNAATDVQNQLPESNPFLRNSFLDAIITSLAGRAGDNYDKLKQVLKQLFPDTTTDEYLVRWAAIFGITRNPATQAIGNITITGTSGSEVPLGTSFQTPAGDQYDTQVAATIFNETINVSSLTRIGQTVSVTTVSDHSFASGINLTIAGAIETDYNGTFEILVTALDGFSYTISTTPSTPATGSITASADIASVEVLSEGFGAAQNLGNGASLSLSTPIVGVDNTAYVQFEEVAGGTDLENDEDLRNRLLDRIQNPIALFNVSSITAKAKEVPGVTRVFVEQPDTTTDDIAVTSINRVDQVATVVTATPHGMINGSYALVSGAGQDDYNIRSKVLVVDDTTYVYVVEGVPATPATGVIIISRSYVYPGQTRVFFTRDNDDNIIPSASEVETVKDKLLEIKPANTAEEDLIVAGPAPITTDFTFTLLTPNTSTMQSSITESLKQLFEEETTVGENLSSFAYESAIFQTIDTTTGDVVKSFALSTPIGDLVVPQGSIPVLGNINF